MGGHVKKAGAVGIRVRMYRVGFGDFFLVTVPGADGKPLHILIDCGVFKGTSQTGDIGSIEVAVDHMAETTGKKLALVIMTHRHADHIAGFARCDAVFKQFTVDAVWMPGWENEYAPNAIAFQTTLTQLADRLRVHLQALTAAAPDNAEYAELFHMMGNATGIEPLAAAGVPKHGSNAAALALLKTGLGAAPEYYVRGDAPKIPKSLADAGLTARVLGPPPISEFDMLKLEDLKKGAGEYLALAADTGNRGTRRQFAPFADSWSDHNASKYPADAFREWALRRIGDRGSLPGDDDAVIHARNRLEDAVRMVQPETLAYTAKTLDSYLNNQSLVVLFTIKGKNLLFVGDAQAGNWEHWLFDTGDRETNPVDPITADAAAILGSLDFYKMGHHGSTNATPIMAATALRADVVAMCSTEKDVYGSVDNESEVPRLPLLDALAVHGATVVRSDQLAVDVDDLHVDAQVAAALPKPAHGTLTAGTCFIDYEL